MKCSLYASVLALSVCGMAWGAPVVPDPGIPANYKSDVDPTGHKSEIVSKVTTELASLANDTETTRQEAAQGMAGE